MYDPPSTPGSCPECSQLKLYHPHGAQWCEGRGPLHVLYHALCRDWNHRRGDRPTSTGYLPQGRSPVSKFDECITIPAKLRRPGVDEMSPAQWVTMYISAFLKVPYLFLHRCLVCRVPTTISQERMQPSWLGSCVEQYWLVSCLSSLLLPQDTSSEATSHTTGERRNKNLSVQKNNNCKQWLWN